MGLHSAVHRSMVKHLAPFSRGLEAEQGPGVFGGGRLCEASMCDVAVPRLELSRLTQPQQIPENTVYQPAKSPPKSPTKSPCKKHKFFMGSRTQAPNDNEPPEAGEGCKPACVPDTSCNPACACRACSQAMRCCCMINHENCPQDRPSPKLCGGEGCHAFCF